MLRVTSTRGLRAAFRELTPCFCSLRPFASNSALGMTRSKKRAKIVDSRGISTSAHTLSQPATVQELEDSTMPDPNSTHATNVTFDSLPLLPQTKGALAKMGYTYCTTVQAASLPVSASGVDLLCKARTGTGKTLAFLIPAIEQHVKARANGTSGVAIMVISPTRELAFQIEKEAKELAIAHRLPTQCVVGGTNAATDIRKLESQSPKILVGTPGRLIDLLENSSLKQKLQSLNTLIYDEADRLLDMGFKPSVDKILKMLRPNSTRQNVMFSATYPEDIKRLARDALRPGYEIVDTVGESSIQTAEKVRQTVVVSSMRDQMVNLAQILQAHQQANPDYKVMVFFTTARLTGLYADIFNQLGFPVLEMHSRKSQSARTKCAEQFRKGNKLMLFSSDVSARGVDYPATSLVVQVGLPSDREQYIHRVGRTARAGTQGQATILLQDFEQGFLNKIKDLPVSKVQSISAQEAPQLQSKIDKAIQSLDPVSVGQSYQAWLGFYNTHLKILKWNASNLVSTANQFATEVLGCNEPPPLQKKTIGKMGLKGVPGLRIEESSPQKAKPQGGRGAPRNADNGFGQQKVYNDSMQGGRGPPRNADSGFGQQKAYNGNSRNGQRTQTGPPGLSRPSREGNYSKQGRAERSYAAGPPGRSQGASNKKDYDDVAW